MAVSAILAAALLLQTGCQTPEEAAPVDPVAAMQRASELMSKRDFDGAVEVLRPAVIAEPWTPALSLLYARALVNNQQSSLAVWYLERIAEDPDSIDAARALYVRALLHGGAEREAVREATAILDVDPDNAVVRRLRVHAHSAILDEPSALDDLAYLVELAPEDPRLRESRIDLLIEMERIDDARAEIDELRVIMEGDAVLPEAHAVFCASTARFEYEQGEVEKAEADLRVCLERHPTEPDVILSLAELLEKEEREGEALAFLRESAAASPGRFRLQNALAQLLLRQGKEEEAEAVLIAAATSVGGAQPHLLLADLRVAGGDPKGAAEAVIDAIRQELGRGPGDADFEWTVIPEEGRFAFGDVFIRAEAYEYAEQIAATLDNEAFRLLLEARMQLDQGRPAEALETYEAAFRLWPSNPAARYLAGRASMEIGEFDQAASFYQDALRADSAATNAGLVLARMQLYRGYPGAAHDTVAFYLMGHPDDPYALRLAGGAAMLAGLYQRGEALRGALAVDPRWAGAALADQAQDIARIRGFAEARSYLEASEELEEPTHYDALSAWAEAVWQLGEPDFAKERVLRLYRASQGEAGPAIAWARLLGKDEQWAEARSVLEGVLEANLTTAALHRELGAVLLQQDEIDAALEHLDRATYLEPEDSRARFMAAQGLLTHDRDAEARDRLTELLIYHPWHGLAAMRLAELAMEEGDFGDETLVQARRAATFHVLSGPGGSALLGRVLLERGESQAAVAELTKAISLGAASAANHYDLGRALQASGQTGAARQAFEAALQDDDFPEAEAARAALEALPDTEAG